MSDDKRLSFFLVDDDPMQLEMVKDHLAKFKNFHIDTYSTGEECLANIDKNPDIIILDYNLNTIDKNAMDGDVVLKKIKQLKPEIEVIMLSGQDKIEVAVKTMTLGAFDYVVKNESEFVRIENIVYKIIKKRHTEREVKVYKTLTISIFVLIVAAFVLTIVLKALGLIPQNIGWI